MPEDEKKKSRGSRIFSLVIKALITIACFWYITTRIDFTEALRALIRVNILYILCGLALFVLSKIFSAIRLNLYFRNIGLHLDTIKNFRLYWLGMFYNLFLPGAISGDAYKVIVLKRRYAAPYKKLASAVLLDRLSGVLALGWILCIYGIIVMNEDEIIWFLFLCAIIGTAGFYFGMRLWFRDFLPSFFSTFLWGLLVQLCQVVCIYCILLGLQLPIQHEWIFIFLASAVISILPISLGGGLGTREVVFAEGAAFFQMDPQTGVVVSLLFYLITVAGSLWGLYYQWKDPLGE